ncbi:UDP-Glycosyltransferase/glycogen phosphorylase [Violaceomyces palustris]|uniref:UDP-Glycosyltransferase/glycogen phosphorylase n=1 Tax=Violaceomyces palustris TaxID=1673888 RepID=A0ACD0P731_9BASI|nr:UDP-Glycosyltransferase/glycogen phosphorylase [Violaceomyces palustris]
MSASLAGGLARSRKAGHRRAGHSGARSEIIGPAGPSRGVPGTWEAHSAKFEDQAEELDDPGAEGDSEDSRSGSDRAARPVGSRNPLLPAGLQDIADGDDPDDADAAPRASLSREALDSLPLLAHSHKSVGSCGVDEQKDLTGGKEQLSLKLRTTFGLDASEDLHSTHSCWMFRSVLLQGHVYLTSGHLCFYAYLPRREDRVLRAGPLSKLTKRTRRFSKHWAVLRGGVLSWYDSERDPYFPQGHIDLRKVSSVDCSTKNPERFKVNTSYRQFTFSVDSEQSRNAWVNALKKELFRSQNEGESVRISIPLEIIIDVDISLSVDQTEMVCVKVVDEDNDFAVDEYYFLHLAQQAGFMENLREMVFKLDKQASPALSKTRSQYFKANVRDSTSGMQAIVPSTASLDEVPSVPLSRRDVEPLHAINIDSAPPTQTVSSVVAATADGAARPLDIGVKAKPSGGSEADEGIPRKLSLDTMSTTPKGTTLRMSMESNHTYPPSPSTGDAPPAFEQVQREAERGWSVPRWIRETPGKVLGPSPTADAFSSWLGRQTRIRRKVKEIWSTEPLAESLEHGLADSQRTDSGADGKEELASSIHSSFSVLDVADGSQALEQDDLAEAQFHEAFALSEKEKLIGYTNATLFRVLPVAGRIFVSKKYLCFRSSGFASKTIGRTLMMLPLSDIVSATRHQPFRYGQHGLVVIVCGHEEVFLEFTSSERRDQCLSMIDLQLDSIRSQTRASHPVDVAIADERSDALILRDLSERLEGGLESSVTSAASSQVSHGADQSGSMFGSSSSAIINFKPKESLHFTMLTIGSRGDVQPYIALAKGLMAEGHRVRIASHPEFRAWVEGHGVEFKEVGGDPAELMRICVENGTFTFSFFREGVTKFRGWLDDLLLSSWKACQGTDIIVESPSAIAGIHVAEALQIPYYRAFTMPWTRTRAYPHAFAVPGSKAGGNYNYMSYVIFDQIFWRASAGQINRWRKHCLGLQATNIDKLEQHKVPFIYNFSPSLVPRPLDWFEWIHVTGFWFLDNPDNSANKSWQAPSDLVGFINRARANNRKLVYIGWGSIVVSDAEAMTRLVFDAVIRSGVCAILSKGWSDRLSSGKGSDQSSEPLIHEDVFQVSSVPHDWLFPQIDAACHHGGAGTLGASLRAGIPTIVRPFFGDQFFWGQQVESLGVGSCVRKLTAASLADALRKATTDPKQIERAKALGVQIRSEDGVANAIKAIYRDFDYACGRIKRDTRLAKKDPKTEANEGVQPSEAVSDPAAGPSPNPSTEKTDAGRQKSPENDLSKPSDEQQDNASCSAGHTSDEWSDIGAPWSPSMSSHGDPSASTMLAVTQEP